MSAAVVSLVSKTSRTLDARPQADEVVTPTDATDGQKLGRLLTRVLTQLAELRRRFAPKRITFTELVSTGTDGAPQRFTLIHKFGTAVEWWVVGVADVGAVVLPLVAEDTDDSTEDTLALDVYFPVTLAVRVEESG